MKAKFRRALRLLLERNVKCEVIGQEECPMMLRWEFLSTRFLKAMVHYFPAEVSDRDPHDHPRPFVTFVLRGNYRDESWRPAGEYPGTVAEAMGIPKCERVHAGAFRYRPAKHLHIVETDEVGCWTLVVMGPIVREWGFVRLTTGLWWEWGKYIQRFGGVARCDAPPDTMGIFSSKNASVIIGGDPAGEYPVTNMKITPASFSKGDFVAVRDPADARLVWDGKVENISSGTAWVRDAYDWALKSVKVSQLERPFDEQHEQRIRDRYHRRSRASWEGTD